MSTPTATLPLPGVPRTDATPPAEFTGQPSAISTAPAAPRKNGATPPLVLDQPTDAPWADPRPDLLGDRQRWWLVLQAAYGLDLNLFGALYVLRQCGARLEIASPPDWSLQPDGPAPTWKITRGEELSEAEYADYRQRYLVPHRAAIAQLLNAQAAAGLAHTTGKNPEKHPRPDAGQARFTGHSEAAASASAAPRKSTADPTAQPALLAIGSERGDL